MNEFHARPRRMFAPDFVLFYPFCTAFSKIDLVVGRLFAGRFSTAELRFFTPSLTLASATARKSPNHNFYPNTRKKRRFSARKTTIFAVFAAFLCPLFSRPRLQVFLFFIMKGRPQTERKSLSDAPQNQPSETVKTASESARFSPSIIKRVVQNKLTIFVYPAQKNTRIFSTCTTCTKFHG